MLDRRLGILLLVRRNGQLQGRASPAARRQPRVEDYDFPNPPRLVRVSRKGLEQLQTLPLSRAGNTLGTSREAPAGSGFIGFIPLLRGSGHSARLDRPPGPGPLSARYIIHPAIRSRTYSGTFR